MLAELKETTSINSSTWALGGRQQRWEENNEMGRKLRKWGGGTPAGGRSKNVWRLRVVEEVQRITNAVEMRRAGGLPKSRRPRAPPPRHSADTSGTT
ncbi:MAG: hypothetical protein QXK11_08995 [Pyrobaculum sp.]|uniref:hypothetical protein n=1 Tax=Pyrobaculum sp. TaxID=2004705 RepID=UPI00316DE9BF